MRPGIWRGAVGIVTMLIALGAMLTGTGAAVASPRAAPTTGQCTAETRLAATPPALDQLQSTSAWTVTRGAGVVVAVVDSGVAANNPHLAGAIAGGIDLVGDGMGQGGYADLDGHGTAIAGEIAARRIGGSGVLGLAPDARILSVRVFSSTGDQAKRAGTGPSIARLAEGIRAAAAARAQIINVSLSTDSDDPELRAAVAYATAAGSLVVASAGNSNGDYAVGANGANGVNGVNGVRYPANDPGALGVTAVNTAGQATSASIHGPHIVVAAPGQNVLTSSSLGGDCVYASDAPATSFSTGYAAAAAALVAGAYPNEKPAQWIYRLEASAVRPSAGARDNQLGWGIVQPYDALTFIPGAGVPGPIDPDGKEGAVPARTTQGVSPLQHQVLPEAAARQIAGLAGLTAAILVSGIAVIGLYLRRRRAVQPGPRLSRATE